MRFYCPQCNLRSITLEMWPGGSGPVPPEFLAFNDEHALHGVQNEYAGEWERDIWAFDYGGSPTTWRCQELPTTLAITDTARASVYVDSLAVREAPVNPSLTVYVISWYQATPGSTTWERKEEIGATVDEALAKCEEAIGAQPGTLKQMFDDLNAMSARFHAAREARGED